MPVGDTYVLHDGERVTVRVARPDLLEVEAEWTALPHKPPVHRHPSQDERFEVHEGELTVEVGGRRHVLRAGDAADVPRGALHKMWNSGDVPCRASWQVRPALRTEGFFRAVHEAREAGRGDEHGMLTPLSAAPILREYRDEFALPMPAPVQAVALAALAAIARIRYAGAGAPGGANAARKVNA